MKFKRMSGRSQRGMTIIELLIVLVLACIVSAAVVMIISTITSNQNRNIAHMSAVKQVENALYWITMDTVQAQNVNVNGAGYFVDMRWTDLSGAEHEAKYVLDATKKVLTRCYDGGATVNVANNIDVTDTTCSFSGGKLTIDLTANALGYPTASEKREVNIFPRPM